ncbi:MAG TPA: cupin domain-containing protein [Methyloceanibacter sp.]|jgi:quercetin dioxygenase-like cupin family protein|nr:cupin domain-containing protein [Methyloceanibacter sp.]
MRTKTAIVAIALAGALAGAGLTFARDAGDQNAVTAEKLIAEALAGDPSKEVTAQLYTFPPGTVLSWHIHPDAHEIAYVIEGTLTFQRAGEAPEQLAAGAADYLAPNIVHRGMNTTDKPVRLFVVRIKPKDKPLVEEVSPPD